MLATDVLAQVQVEIGGRLLDTGMAAALERVEISQALSVPSRCELTFSEPEPSMSRGLVDPGTAMRVMVAGREPALFEGDITAAEWTWASDQGRTLRVRGYDRLHRLRRRQTVRTFTDVTVADLVQAVAGDLGMSLQASEQGPRWSRVIQGDQNDLRLLVEVAESAGLYLCVRGPDLLLLSLAGTGEAVPIALGDTLLEASVEVNEAAAFAAVAARTWDPATADTIEGEATRPRGRLDVATSVDPGPGGGGVRLEIIDHASPSIDRATATAQAALDQAHAATVVLRATTVGDARLAPGIPVAVSGLGASVAGTYLTEVEHRLDAGHGYLVTLSSAPPAPRFTRRAGATACTLGKVVHVDDPLGAGRVQVTLPAYRDVESSWMQVLSVAAGAGKGLVALPDVGDQVLVLFADGDPAQGVVLGGLYGTAGPSDSGVVSGAVRRFLLGTAGGQLLRLDDEHDSLRIEDKSGGVVELSDHHIRLEDATGNRIELARDVLRLHAAVPLELDAPGQRVTIRASSVDFETA